MKDIVIYGAGGMGKEVVWLIENINLTHQTWTILGFLVDDEYSTGDNQFIRGYPIFPANEWLSNHHNEIYVVCGIGKSTVRKSIYEKVIKFPHVKLATLIDPTVRVDESVTIGAGTLICRNCTVTVDTKIGCGVLMNTGSSVGHDSEVGDYCTLLTNSIVAGRTTLGECCEIGSGAFILQGKSIIANIVVAPISSIFKDITESGTYAGNPARRMI